MNPIDWGGTPLANAAIRGVVAVLVLGLVTSGKAYFFDGAEITDALGEGAILFGTSFLILLGYGGSDQNRANTGVVITGDVPVQIEASADMKRVADMAPGSKSVARTPEQIASAWTRRGKDKLSLTA